MRGNRGYPCLRRRGQTTDGEMEMSCTERLIGCESGPLPLSLSCPGVMVLGLELVLMWVGLVQSRMGSGPRGAADHLQDQT